MLVDIADHLAQSADEFAEILLIKEYFMFFKRERSFVTFALRYTLAFCNREEEFALLVALYVQIIDSLSSLYGL
jgi:hypothetical protein